LRLRRDRSTIRPPAASKSLPDGATWAQDNACEVMILQPTRNSWPSCRRRQGQTPVAAGSDPRRQRPESYRVGTFWTGARRLQSSYGAIRRIDLMQSLKSSSHGPGTSRRLGTSVVMVIRLPSKSLSSKRVADHPGSTAALRCQRPGRGLSTRMSRLHVREPQINLAALANDSRGSPGVEPSHL
jgi:hypothetical protein